MIKVYGMNLRTIFPSSISRDNRVQFTADAISENINSTSGKITSDLIYSRIDSAEDNVLDALAWQFHMDIYDSSLRRESKSALVKGSVKYHRYKGTVFALEEAIKAVSASSNVKEWFAYSGQPYHFKVRTTTPFKNAEHVKRLYKAIQDAKNVRSWLDGIEYRCTKPLPLYVGVIRRQRRKITIYPANETAIELEDAIYIGMAMVEEETIEMEA